jgi:hypothetical protein
MKNWEYFTLGVITGIIMCTVALYIIIEIEL